MAYDTIAPRLASRFRSDAHNAIRLEQQPRNDILVTTLINLSGDRIEYWETAGIVERRLLVGEQVAQRERFRLGATTTASWITIPTSPALLRLQIQRATRGAAKGLRRVDVVDASVGLDHQYAFE